MVFNKTKTTEEVVHETDPLWEKFIDFIVSELTGQYGMDRLAQNPPNLEKLPWTDSKDEVQSSKVYSTSLTKTERRLMAMADWSWRESTRCDSKRTEMLFRKLADLFRELFWGLILSRYSYPSEISIRSDFSLIGTPERHNSEIGKLSGGAGAALLAALLLGKPPDE